MHLRPTWQTPTALSERTYTAGEDSVMTLCGGDAQVNEHDLTVRRLLVIDTVNASPT
jgi:hypothetical protein